MSDTPNNHSSSFDRDGDSLMSSASDNIPKPSTPIPQTRFANISDLSPPNSQGVPLPSSSSSASVAAMPSVAPAASGANVNGKRPIESIDHAAEGGGVSLSGTAAAQEGQNRPAGAAYTWTRAEDEPGYSWKNKKAQEDYSRAWDALVDKNRRIGNKYGDPFAMADRELDLMQQQQHQAQQ